MPMFVQPSLGNLMRCHADLQLLFFEVVRTHICVVTGVREDVSPSMAVQVFPCDLEHNLFDCEKLQHFFVGFVMGVASRLHAEGKMLYRIWYENGFFELRG